MFHIKWWFFAVYLRCSFMVYVLTILQMLMTAVDSGLKASLEQAEQKAPHSGDEEEEGADTPGAVGDVGRYHILLVL